MPNMGGVASVEGLYDWSAVDPTPPPCATRAGRPCTCYVYTPDDPAAPRRWDRAACDRDILDSALGTEFHRVPAMPHLGDENTTTVTAQGSSTGQPGLAMWLWRDNVAVQTTAWAAYSVTMPFADTDAATNGTTQITVCRLPQAGTYGTNQSFIWLSGNERIPWTNNYIYTRFGGASAMVIPATPWYDRTFIMAVVSNPATNQARLFVDSPTVPAATVAYGASHLTLNPTTPSVWEGVVSELRVYDRALSASQLTEVFTTLGTKHGVTVSP
jgi:hypothetical protein